MPMRFKVDVLEKLKAAGYNTNRIRKEKLLSEWTLQHIRNGEPISWGSIETICGLLHCQPGDILEFKIVTAD